MRRKINYKSSHNVHFCQFFWRYQFVVLFVKALAGKVKPVTVAFIVCVISCIQIFKKKTFAIDSQKNKFVLGYCELFPAQTF